MSDPMRMPSGGFNLPPGVTLRDIDPGDEDECPVCKGSGVDPEDEDCACPECSGLGVVNMRGTK